MDTFVFSLGLEAGVSSPTPGFVAELEMTCLSHAGESHKLTWPRRRATQRARIIPQSLVASRCSRTRASWLRPSFAR